MASETKRTSSRSVAVGKKPSITKKTYVKITPFEPKEIIAVATNCKNWMSLADEAPGSEKMKANGVRFLDIQAAGWNFETKKETSHRRLCLAATPCRTKSRCKPGKADEGKVASCVVFCTHMKHVDAFTDEKKLTAYLETDACEVVDTKFPGIADTEFDAKVNQQRALLLKEHELEYAQWLINNEYLRLMNDPATQDKLDWTAKRTDKIQGNIQTHRLWSKEADKDIPKPKAGSDGVPLEMPIARFRLRVDKATGEIWCKIYDVTDRKPTDKRPKLATVKNDAGKDTIVDYGTIEEWLRPTSVVSGQIKYAICICASGIFLHASYTELNVRRAAQSQATAATSKLVMDDMGDYGGNYDNSDETNDAPAKPTASKTDLDNIINGLRNED